MRTILSGTEANTLELDGTIDASLDAGVRALVPAPLELDGGPVRVNLLLFAMRGLHLRVVPWPRFDYREALWRVAVRVDHQPAWLAIACDLDRALIRGFGRVIVRYPTRVAQLSDRDGWSVEAAGATFTARVHDPGVSPEPIDARRVFVRDGAHLYEIPWHERAAAERHTASVEVVADTLSRVTFGSPVTWAADGLVHRGRIHMCGIARPARAE